MYYLNYTLMHSFYDQSLEQFGNFLFVVSLIGLVVFVVLYFVNAGYGKMISNKWGPTIPNKVGWCIMECPVFFLVLYFWGKSTVTWLLPYLIFFLLFEFHYVYRSFVFPFLMRGHSQMPVAIVLLSVIFNLLNGYIQGYWLFELAPGIEYYSSAWLTSWQFILGTVIFVAGLTINWHSDSVIRHLRKPGDTNHYLPSKGLYKYVTSANYLGEIIEWIGFAILTWSWAGLVFAWFTMANLVPRSNAIYHKYEQEFPEEFHQRKLKRIIPFVY